MDSARPSRDFNPLPPHGGRHNIFIRIRHSVCISIHSLRMEGDSRIRSLYCSQSSFQSTPSAWRETHTVPEKCNFFAVFQSTPSAWRETEFDIIVLVQLVISIHSLRMEGDLHFHFRISDNSYFNPLPPHGGRQISCGVHRWKIYFNPLPPHGGRPFFPRTYFPELPFQSTPSAWRETQ